MCAKSTLLLAVLCSLANIDRFVTACDPANEPRPNWTARMNPNPDKYFAFQVSVRPAERSSDGWKVDGWTNIRALLEPAQNGGGDTDPKLAL